jgi:uncharacterized protein YecE (DUF72 family)
MSPCLTGPGGWSFPQWNGIVYPRPRPRGFHALDFLSKYVNLVEINTSFHQPLRPEVSRLWLSKTAHNKAFRFTAKLGRRFTHERIIDAADIAAYKEGFWPLQRAGRLGGVIMQFPWSFRFTSENKDYFIKLRRTFHEFPLAAEMRHASWICDEAIGTFVDYRVGFVNVDLEQRFKSMPPAALLTSSIGYVRFHGRAQCTEDGGSKYLYSYSELLEWKDRIDHLRTHADAVYVSFTNTDSAYALVNSLQAGSLAEIRSAATVPAGLVRRYPMELAGFHPDHAVQQSLFTGRAA